MVEFFNLNFEPVSHAIMSSMQYYSEDIIAYAIMSAGRFCICNRVSRTLLHDAPVNRCRMQLCPLCNTIRGHYCIMSAGRFCICNRVSPDAAAWCNCVRPDTFAYAVVSAPVQNRPCTKLNALGRRNTFALFYKLSVCHEWRGKCSAVWYSLQS